MTDLLHPAIPFVLAIPMLLLARGWGQRLLTVLAPLAALAMILLLPDGRGPALVYATYTAAPLHVDALARIFAVAFALYGVVAALYAWHEQDTGSRAAALGLCGAGVGLTLAGDLLSAFLFWEMLAVCSTFLIWFGRTPQSFAAGLRYSMFHFAGGLCFLGGIAMHLAAGRNPALQNLVMDHPASWLMLAGVAVNAAVIPLHAWLPDAYPRASIFGTVFLAAFTTKGAVYLAARLFPGLDLLVWAGAAMTLYGVFFAVLENDIRRLLAYHIVSQVGYMICGIGLGSAMALNGSVSHAFAHIFYKGLLLMSAGALIWATGHGKLTDLGGLARPLKWVLVLFMIGAFSIAGMPLFNGFISKSMVISAAAEAHRAPIEIMLQVASMGTFLSIGLKLAWFAFFGEPGRAATPVVRPVPASMYLAMWLSAALCFITGIAPDLLYHHLPYDYHYHPYTLDHILTALQLLTATALGFWILKRIFVGPAKVTLDVDRLYRTQLPWLTLALGAAIQGLFQSMERTLERAIAIITSFRERPMAARSRVLGYRVAIAAILIATLWITWLATK